MLPEDVRETIRVIVTAVLSLGILALAFADVAIRGQADSPFLPMAAIVVGYWFGARVGAATAGGSLPPGTTAKRSSDRVSVL